MTSILRLRYWVILTIILIPVMYVALFFVAEHIPRSTNPHSVLVVSVTYDNRTEPFRGAIRTVGGEADSTYFDVNLGFRHFAYYDFENVTAFELVGIRSGEAILTIPKGSIASRDRISVNLDTHEVTRGIPLSHLRFMYGGYFWHWVLLTGISIFFLYTLCLLIPALILMFAAIFRRHPTGAKRRFSGSIPHFIFCIIFVLIFIMAYLVADYEGRNLLTDTAAGYDDFFVPFLAAYMLGTGLYLFAHRSYYGREIRRRRREKVFDDINRADTVQWVTVTRHSNGIRTTDESERRLWQFIYMIIFWIIRMLLAPFFVYFAIIQNYLFDRHPTDAVTPSSSGGSSAPASSPPVPWDGAASFVFALWPPDMYYYPANITARNGNIVDLHYLDNETRQADISELISSDSLMTMQVSCNYAHKGLFYPCHLRTTANNRFEAVYQDGATEIVGLDQMRLK